MVAVGEAFIEIKADTDNLARQAASDIDRILGRISPEIEVELDVSTAAIRDIEDTISGLDGQVIELAADLNDAALDDLEADLGSLDGQVIDIVSEVDDSDIDDIVTQISAVDGEAINVAVNAADGDLGSLESRIASLDGQIIDLSVAVDDSGLDGLGEDLDAVGASGEAAGGVFAGLVAGSRFGPVATGATAAAVAVGALGGEIIELESGLNEVASLQIPGFGFDEARETVSELISQTGVASEEAIPALYGALSAGVPPDNVLDFLISSQELAVAGVADLADASGLLTGAANAYGDDLGDMNQATNALFATVQSGVTTIPELGASLGQVTPLAAEVGVTFEELNAAVATSTQVTQNTARTVTGLNGLFAELGRSSSIAGGNFAELAGETFPEFLENGGDLQGALELLSQGAEDSGRGLNELFGSVEAGAVALQLTREDGEAFASTLDNIQTIAGDGVAVEAAVEINEASLGVQFSQLSNRIQGFLGDAGLGVSGILAQGLASINNLLANLDFGSLFGNFDFGATFSKFFDSASERLQVFSDLIGKLDLGSIDFSFITTGLKTFSDLFFGFNDLVTQFISDNQDAFVSIFDAAVDIFNTLGGVLETVFTLISDNQDTIFSIFNFLGEVFVFIAEALAFVLPPLIEFIGFMFELNVAILTPLIDVISNVIGFLFDLGAGFFNILTNIGEIFPAIGGFFSSIPGVISGAVGAAVSAAGNFGSSIVDAVVGFVTGLLFLYHLYHILNDTFK